MRGGSSHLQELKSNCSGLRSYPTTHSLYDLGQVMGPLCLRVFICKREVIVPLMRRTLVKIKRDDSGKALIAYEHNNWSLIFLLTIIITMIVIST